MYVDRAMAQNDVLNMSLDDIIKQKNSGSGSKRQSNRKVMLTVFCLVLSFYVFVYPYVLTEAGVPRLPVSLAF